MSAAESCERIVVVHGPADPMLAAVLRSAGLRPVVELGGATVWSPQVVQQPVTPAAAEQRPSLLTVAEAAAALTIGRSTVYELGNRGELEVVHVGRCARIPADAVDDYLARLRSGEPGRGHRRQVG